MRNSNTLLSPLCLFPSLMFFVFRLCAYVCVQYCVTQHVTNSILQFNSILTQLCYALLGSVWRWPSWFRQTTTPVGAIHNTRRSQQNIRSWTIGVHQGWLWWWLRADGTEGWRTRSYRGCRTWWRWSSRRWHRKYAHKLGYESSRSGGSKFATTISKRKNWCWQSGGQHDSYGLAIIGIRDDGRFSAIRLKDGCRGREVWNEMTSKGKYKLYESAFSYLKMSSPFRFNGYYDSYYETSTYHVHVCVHLHSVSRRLPNPSSFIDSDVY